MPPIWPLLPFGFISYFFSFPLLTPVTTASWCFWNMPLRLLPQDLCTCSSLSYPYDWLLTSLVFAHLSTSQFPKNKPSLTFSPNLKREPLTSHFLSHILITFLHLTFHFLMHHSFFWLVYLLSVSAAGKQNPQRLGVFPALFSVMSSTPRTMLGT